jgi:hypothetical protein
MKKKQLIQEKKVESNTNLILNNKNNIIIHSFNIIKIINIFLFSFLL